MNAILLSHHGGPEVLQLSEIAVPRPEACQVLIKHAAIGVNFVDTQHRAGQPYTVRLPFIPGVEASGTVLAVGPHVSAFQIGDRVAYCGHMHSVYAEYGIVPDARLVPVPDALELADAAAILMQGMTAHMLAHSVRPLRAGEYIFIHAAAGGVALNLIQIAKAQGATVFGTASTPAKAAFARAAGADHIWLSSDTDVVAEVRTLTGGEGVHVVYDSVGQATFDQSLDLLRPAGLAAIFGLSSGNVPPFDINRLSGIAGASSKGSLFLTWPTLNVYTAQRANLLWHAGAVFDAVVAGRLKPYIADTLSLAEAAHAHRLLEERQVIGKLLLRP